MLACGHSFESTYTYFSNSKEKLINQTHSQKPKSHLIKKRISSDCRQNPEVITIYGSKLSFIAVFIVRGSL